MFRYFSKTSKGLTALALAFSGVLSPALSAELVGVRFGVSSPTETRIVLDVAGAPEYALEAASDARLDIRLHNSRSAASLPSTGKGAGQAEGYGAAVSSTGVVVSVSLKFPTKIKDISVIPPSASNPRHRLVIDLAKAKPGSLVASLPAKKFDTLAEVIASVDPAPAAIGPAVTATGAETIAASPASSVIVPPPPSLAAVRRLPTIVIDAGHGGTDPGASGQKGTSESIVTLAAAEALAESLRETGRYEVILTRSLDKRLAHEERSRIARSAKADLFISLHADAHSDPAVRGGSVYTLSDEGTERSAREALASGNYVVHDYNVGEADPALGRTLYKVVQSRTENESDRFAELLIGKLAGVTPLLNNTHRQGNFKVLLSPDVPAVLLELAFISNKFDEANLASPAWRKRTMGAVSGAIDAYFQQRASAKHASNTPAAEQR